MTSSIESLPVLGNGIDATSAVRRLWATAARIDAVVADPGRLHRLLGDIDDPGPQPVRLVHSRPCDDVSSAGWECARLATDPTPEFVLFHRAGRDFPDCALVFSGATSEEVWWTWHQRPFVLQRLRERFGELHEAARRCCATDDRATSLAGTSRSSAGAWQIRESRFAAGTTSPADQATLVTPAELYQRVLAVHFAASEEQDARANTIPRPDSAPTLALHQQRAYERARNILERFGGVIVADAVGLGKTYVGVRLLERTVADGGHGLVIVPAALRQQWARELAYLGLAPPQRQRQQPIDRIDNLDLWVQESAPVALISLEAMGRNGFDRAAHRGADLVVVDEAHNFRNPTTRRYRALLEVARHSRIALLTATPINNSVRDLERLIDLFAAPGAFRYLGIADYRRAFRDAADGNGDIDRIISACVVRRTRRCLRTAYGGLHIPCVSSDGTTELRFPRRASPAPVAYDLGGTYGNLFDTLDDWLEELSFPSVVADAGAAGDGDPGVAALLKIILLKRLESSIEAFRASVVGQLAWCSTALRALDAGRVLTRPDYRSRFRGSSDDPGGQLALFELMLPAPTLTGAPLGELCQALERDLNLLAHIHAKLAAIGPPGDQKLQRLLGLLDGPLAGGKILLFTEFRDTARYLYRQLRHRPHVAEIDSGGARLGLDRVPRRDVIERFAPVSNGLPEPHERERVDLLIATDVLSEGLNLQDADVVVSYDLPWNPVRLMQRVGRIDRLGALAEVVQLHHFVPDRDLDRLLGLMARLRTKLEAIDSTIGLDHPVLGSLGTSADDTLERVRRLALDPDEFERVEEEIEGPLDPEEQAYLDYISQGGDVEPDPRAVSPTASAVAFVTGSTEVETCATAQTPHNQRAVAYWRLTVDGAARGMWLIYDHETGHVVEDQSTALQELRRARDTGPAQRDDRLLAATRRGCLRYARSVVARLQAARIAGDALGPALPQSRIAAWLSRYYASAEDRLNAVQRERLDDLLDRIGRRFTLATERALAGVAQSLPERATPADVDRVTRAIAELADSEEEPIRAHEVALLLVTYN